MLRSLLCALLLASTYNDSIEAWRSQREQSLKAPDGWLSVAGLFWLNEGDNRAGSDPGSDIVLPGRAPKTLGVFHFENGSVEFRAAANAGVTLNGRGVQTTPLRPNTDQLRFADFTLFVIRRGGKTALRLRDPESSMRRGFTHLDWYPVNEALRLTARFTPFPEPRQVPIPNILGMTENMTSPGYVTFELNGETYRLDPVLEDDQLFFIFRDQTAGKTTYGAGRFVYADLPKNGQIVLDFNKAYNPPCAFTPFATCPLPPRQNRLPIAIEAGEKNYGEHH